MVYAVLLIIFMDDVSGNVLKQWNKHHAIYMSNANLPCEMLDKEFCVCFVTLSPHAAPMELMGAMKESISWCSKAHKSGIVAWDCKEGEEVLLIPYGLFVAGDNPMQAEECSHAGLNCNYFCCTCHVGGTKQYKESETSYNSLFVPGLPQTPEETASTIEEHVQLSLASGVTEKIKTSTTSTGVHDTSTSSIIETLVELGKQLQNDEIKAILEKKLEDILQGRMVQDSINPLLGMEGITNIHMDTPTEILHTVLLGVVKYFWGQTAFLLEKSHLLDVFQSHLDSVDKDGLNAPSLNADYICWYRGSLIGKHFKSLAQVMPFLIYNLVSKAVLDAWTVIGELVVLIWHTEITIPKNILPH
ncbi:hypothetical protein J3A83DRAFT_4356462 [Scleroderma citrinum]